MIFRLSYSKKRINKQGNNCVVVAPWTCFQIYKNVGGAAATEAEADAHRHMERSLLTLLAGSRTLRILVWTTLQTERVVELREYSFCLQGSPNEPDFFSPELLGFPDSPRYELEAVIVHLFKESTPHYKYEWRPCNAVLTPWTGLEKTRFFL